MTSGISSEQNINPVGVQLGKSKKEHCEMKVTGKNRVISFVAEKKLLVNHEGLISKVCMSLGTWRLANFDHFG